MCNVNVYQIGEKQAQEGYARQFTIHVHVAYFAPVIARVEHQVGQAFELCNVTFGHVLRPRLFQAIYWRRFQSHYDSHERVERMQLVQSFGYFYEMAYHFASRFDSFAIENFLLAPKRGLIEATRKMYNVRRFLQFVTRHPFAADQLFGLNGFEKWQIDECQLAGYFIRVDFQNVKYNVVKLFIRVGFRIQIFRQ